jgi:hypothetical protein
MIASFLAVPADVDAAAGPGNKREAHRLSVGVKVRRNAVLLSAGVKFKISHFQACQALQEMMVRL